MKTTTNSIADISARQAALAAGLSLLLMAVFAPYAHFAVLQSLVVPGDAETTAANIIDASGLFRTGIVLLLVVIILDVVVAWGLYVFLKPVNASLSLLAAWLRLVYAAAFMVSLTDLLNALQLLSNANELSAFQPHQLHTQAMLLIDSFRNGWDLSLAIFGIHLLLLGQLVFKFGPRILGILVAVAGAGYMFDSIGKTLVADYSMTISMYTFIGEVLLIFWLLWKGIKGIPDPIRQGRS